MIFPVLLSGGSGTRLWPLSRKSYPKQFAPLLSEETLFQASIKRLAGPDFAAPLIITGSPFRFIVAQQLAEIGVDPSAVVIEPEARNTAPAVLAAALYAAKSDPNSLILIAPSDHVVPDTAAFQAMVGAATDAAKQGRIVTFGVKPTYPETGYGYLELDEALTDFTPKPYDLRRFVEKPDGERASQMLSEGRFLWNAGIFLFSAKTMIAAFERHAPETLAAVSASVANAEADLGFLRLEAESWAKAEDISIDYAIMEKADNLSVVPFDGKWSDLGGWQAVQRESELDDHGNAVSDHATAIDCTNSLLRSEDERMELIGIGLDNIAAIAMPDAVLVTDIRQGENVRAAVKTLKARGATQAEAFPKDHRPWGWFESLVIGERFQVKRIVVHPGAALSLQSHHHRSEHWIVVAGTARVTVDDEVKLVTENQSVYIPLGAVHRMENPGKVPMVLIEVQTGSYLGEDDIIRYEDVYARK